MFQNHRRKDPGHGLRCVPESVPKTACLILDTLVGKIPPRYLGVWPYVPQLPLPVADGCQILLLMGETKTKDLLFHHNAHESLYAII